MRDEDRNGRATPAADPEEPANEPHEPLAETPDDIPEGQAEPDDAEESTNPVDPPSAG